MTHGRLRDANGLSAASAAVKWRSVHQKMSFNPS